VAESAEARSDAPLKTSILAGAVPLESILCTEELRRRPSRPPNHEKENRALVNLVSALADSPASDSSGRAARARYNIERRHQPSR